VPQPITIRMPPLHPNQQLIRDHPARFKIVSAGRRFGKTNLGAVLCLSAALRGGRAWWVAPTYKTAKIGWRLIQHLCKQIPGAVPRLSDLSINFPSGGYLQVHTAQNPDTLRGEGLDYVVLDEAAFMLETVWRDVIQPMLADRLGSALFISTPNGRNWFWNMFMLGRDEHKPLYRSFQFSSLDNPYFPPSEFERLQDDMPADTFGQEHLAQFIEDAGLVFRRVKGQAKASVGDFKPKPNRTYAFGVDWGRYHDFTVVAVVERETQQLVDIDRFNRVSWELQRERIHRLYEKWMPYTILAEQNSIGDVNIEALQLKGLPVQPFSTTQRSKAKVIEALSLDLEREQAWLLDDEQLVNEFIAYTMERTKDGQWKYSAPAGFFDDCVIATALAFEATRGAGDGLGIG
jgi:hypothetical protein